VSVAPRLAARCSIQSPGRLLGQSQIDQATGIARAVSGVVSVSSEMSIKK
jgi:hypothetical protein